MAKYKLSSDTIMSKILEKNKLGLKCNRFDFPDQIMSISSNKILAQNVDDRISEMKNEGLIVKDQGSITLALKGEKRFKRTTERDRDRWKREISDIVCSWIRPVCTS